MVPLGKAGAGMTQDTPQPILEHVDKTLTQADFWKDNYTDGTPVFLVDNSIDIGAEARFSGLDVDDAVTLTPCPWGYFLW